MGPDLLAGGRERPVGYVAAQMSGTRDEAVQLFNDATLTAEASEKVPPSLT